MFTYTHARQHLRRLPPPRPDGFGKGAALVYFFAERFIDAAIKFVSPRGERFENLIWRHKRVGYEGVSAWFAFDATRGQTVG